MMAEVCIEELKKGVVVWQHRSRLVRYVEDLPWRFTWGGIEFVAMRAFGAAIFEVGHQLGRLNYAIIMEW